MIANVLQLELIMVILVIVGIVLRRRGTITDSVQDGLTDLLVDLIIPCNIITSLQTDLDRELLAGSLSTVLISVVTMFLTAVFGWLIYRRRDEREGKVYRYGLISSNAMFIGLPVIQSLLGSDGVLQLNFFMIFTRMFVWSYGLSLYTGVRADWRTSFWKQVSHPCMIGLFVGLFFPLTGLEIPNVIFRTLGYISDCLMFLSMMLIGVIMAEMDRKRIFQPDLWLYSFIRLVGIPGITLILCIVFRLHYIITATCTLLTGMPSAGLTAVLASRYHGDAELGSLVVAITTLLSTVTIPLWFLLISHLGLS